MMEETHYTADPLTEAAQNNFGINYLFPYQRLVISNILEAASAEISGDSEDRFDPPSKQIVILPTGAGKSLCFMLPAVLLSAPTLVIFPLLSLISDQLRRCEEAGIGAACLTGGQSSLEREAVFSGIADRGIQIVLSNPETALSAQILPRLKDAGFLHLVFDEVHTMSEWGDTFRATYLESRRIYKEADIPIITAFTATASETVLSRVKEILFPGDCPYIVSANPDRPNISYTILPSLCKINSLQMLLSRIEPGQPADILQACRPALIFCATRRAAERTALHLRLRLRENEIFFYHAGLSREEKAKIEKWFHASTNGILAATIAFGMGIDKPDVRTVIHHDLSPSVEAYLQESGRAGRDREPAEAILLLSPSDIKGKKLRSSTPLAAERYAGLLKFATDSSTCRRESLMRLLGAEPDTCFGCDVCRKAVVKTAAWQQEILWLIRHNRRVLSQPAAVKMLHRKFPQLMEEDAEAMISEMLIAGTIKKIRRGPWKNKLTVASYKKQLHNHIDYTAAVLR